MTILNECPECDTLETDRQMIDWHRDGVELVYTCYSCNIDFAVWLGQPVKEIIHEYEEAEP